MKNQLYNWKVYVIFCFLISSCTFQRHVTYLQDIDKDGDENFYPKEKKDYRIQAQDILSIKIISINPEVNAMFSNVSIGSGQSMLQNETSLYVNGYVVNDSGFVEIPTIGLVKLQSRTLQEAKEIISEQVKKYIKKATVDVKLISFKFTVLGEVNNPGMYRNYNNQLTVLEAIGKAGDITEYGDRKKVLVLRPEKDGTKSFRIDLTSKDILQSNAFYLLPNDLVYVEPIKSKLFKMNAPSYGLFLSSITTLILIINFIDKGN